MTRTQWTIVALLLILAVACFEPRYEEGIACSELGTCPPGMICDPVSHRCRIQAGPGVCGDGVVNESAGEICDPGADACCAATCDALLAADTECRPSTGPCDPAEVCTGTSAACPPDELAPAMTECRSGNGTCDPAEVCDGLGPECPGNATLPDGSTCSDCTSGLCDTCTAGVCPDLCGNGAVDTGAGEQCEVGDDAACPGHCVNDCTCAYPPSCQAYLAAVPGSPSGIYTIDVDGTGANQFGVYCDMVTDGGGWTLVGDYISNKELFSFDPTRHQLQNDAGGAVTPAPPLLDGTIHGHIAYDLIPFTTTRLQCRSNVMEPWFSAQTTLFQDWAPGDRGTYGSPHWAIIGGGDHGRSNHYICGYVVNTSGVYAGIAICDGPGSTFANHVVSMSFNSSPGSYGGGLAIGCNGGGITYGKDGSWQGRVWLR